MIYWKVICKTKNYSTYNFHPYVWASHWINKQCFTITIKFWSYQKIGRMFGVVKHGLRRVCWLWFNHNGVKSWMFFSRVFIMTFSFVEYSLILFNFVMLKLIGQSMHCLYFQNVYYDMCIICSSCFYCHDFF